VPLTGGEVGIMIGAGLVGGNARSAELTRGFAQGSGAAISRRGEVQKVGAGVGDRGGRVGEHVSVAA
jgi:hypothetical protein